MKLTRAVPEAKEKLESGSLSLSSANMLGSFLSDAPSLSSNEKVQLLQKVDSLPKRKVEEVLHQERKKRSIAPVRKRDSYKCEGEDIRFSTTISKSTMHKLLKVKNYKKKEFDELLSLMADAMLEKIEQDLKPKRKSVRANFIYKMQSILTCSVR